MADYVLELAEHMNPVIDLRFRLTLKSEKPTHIDPGHPAEWELIAVTIGNEEYTERDLPKKLWNFLSETGQEYLLEDAESEALAEG